MATRCPRCTGHLTIQSRFCQTVCLRCAVCAGLYVQVVPIGAIEQTA